MDDDRSSAEKQEMCRHENGRKESVALEKDAHGEARLERNDAHEEDDARKKNDESDSRPKREVGRSSSSPASRTVS